MGRLEAVASYLDGCIFTVIHTVPIVPGQRLYRWQYECKARIQLCAILSLLNRHESAQAQSLEATKLAERIIQETTRICREILSSSKLPKKPNSAAKVFPTLEGLRARIGIKPFNPLTPARKIDLRTVLGVHPFDHWIYRFNIGDLMKVDTVEICEVKQGKSALQEICPDDVYEKIALLAVGYFSLATEMRFLARKEGKRSGKERESELWHRKALSIVRDFLPAEIPLYEHMKQSFDRNYPRPSSLSRPNGSPQRRKKSSKPLLKTFDSGITRLGFRSPKEDTAEAVRAEIAHKGSKKPRCISVGRPISAPNRPKRPQADSSPVIIVSSIPTEESEDCSQGTDSELISLQQKRREKKVNVSILDEEESSTVKAVSPASEKEEIVLTSSVLYGEEIGMRGRPASLGDFQRKKVLR